MKRRNNAFATIKQRVSKLKKAQRSWLKERDSLVNELKRMIDDLQGVDTEMAKRKSSTVRRRKRLEKDEIKNIVKQYEEGKSVSELSREHGVHVVTIYNWIRKSKGSKKKRAVKSSVKSTGSGQKSQESAKGQAA